MIVHRTSQWPHSLVDAAVRSFSDYLVKVSLNSFFASYPQSFISVLFAQAYNIFIGERMTSRAKNMVALAARNNIE